VSQTFDDDEVLPALNVTKISLPEYDIDFIKNKIFHDYKNSEKLVLSDIDFLYRIFQKDFSEIEPQTDVSIKDTAQAIDIITDEYDKEKAALIHAVFAFLRRR
ncbi:MAG TPA: hypothetical protein VKY32_08825, partial [Flavobacterium sp.]|nr:hypothetical protein [Flavobacterium sp.]